MMCKKECSFLNHSKIRLAVVYFSVLLSAPLFGCTDNGGSSPLECREDGQTLCVGKRFRVCDGRQWGAFQDCPKGQVCTDSTTCGEEEASPNPKAGDACDPQSWSDMCDTSDPKAKLVCGSNGLIEHVSCPAAGQSCHKGTCVCETLDSKFTYDATCNKTGCTDSALKFDGVDCVAATDPCDGVDCHDGMCSNGTCDCSGLDDKFTYDATCIKAGCKDTNLSFDGVDCVVATDPCDGVDCHDGTCSEGTCDCSALDGYNDDKFEFSETCEKSCKNGMSVDDNCAECGEGDTQCVIEYDKTALEYVYLMKTCNNDGSWADPVACNDGEICNEDKTDCVAMSEVLTCENGNVTCQTVGTQEYLVFCSSGKVAYKEPCLGRTACDADLQSCVDITCPADAACNDVKLASIRCSDNPAYDGKYSAFKADVDVNALECTEDCKFDFDKYCYTCDDLPACDLKTTYTCDDFDNTKTWKAGGAPVCDGCALTLGTCEEDGA